MMIWLMIKINDIMINDTISYKDQGLIVDDILYDVIWYV